MSFAQIRDDAFGEKNFFNKLSVQTDEIRAL